MIHPLEPTDREVLRLVTNGFHISANSFRGNYSFLNLWSQYIKLRKLIKVGNYVFAEIRYFENFLSK